MEESSRPQSHTTVTTRPRHVRHRVSVTVQTCSCVQCGEPPRPSPMLRALCCVRCGLSIPRSSAGSPERFLVSALRGGTSFSFASCAHALRRLGCLLSISMCVYVTQCLCIAHLSPCTAHPCFRDGLRCENVALHLHTSPTLLASDIRSGWIISLNHLLVSGLNFA